MAEERSGVAIGFTMFAAVMLAIIGFLQALSGIAAIANDQAFVVTKDAVFKMDLTSWGWVHLVLGIVIFLASFGVIRGVVWARTIGVALATVSIVANFAYVAVAPIWAIVLIALNIMVIWALTVHGRDIAS